MQKAIERLLRARRLTPEEIASQLQVPLEKVLRIQQGLDVVPRS
jgi:hypothetical protein